MDSFPEAGRVLVVDDDPQVLKFCQRSLERPGLTVALAGSPEEALDRMRGGAFDLVLSDIRMASPDAGVALAEDIRSRWPETDVVMMTGAPGLDTALPSLKAGISDYLAKPFPAQTLEAAVERVLGRRRLAAGLKTEAMLRAELSAAYVELQKAELAKDAILSRVGHELRTPVFIARMALDLLEPEVRSEAGKTFLDKLSGAVARMEAAVEDLFMYAGARRGALRPAARPLALRPLLENVAASLKPMWKERGLAVELAVEGPDRPLRADPDLLRAAFERLMLNAIRFNRRDGAIRILARRVRAPAGSGREEARISFSDEGPGLPAGEEGRVFDGFYQAADHMTREVGGLGVGLAVVRAVAEAHGGRAEAASLPERGSVFTFAIPADP